MCASASEFNDILRQMTDYVAYRHRRGDTAYDLGQAVLAHRAQCLHNLLDEEEDAWRHRVEVLDAIAQAHGISLEGEDTLREVVIIISDRERVRRSEEVARHR